MDIRPKNKVQASFSMSGMTDVIFLLLLFFILTNSFITPSGLPVNLPASRTSEVVLQKVSVTITDDLRYLVNDKPVTESQLEGALRAALTEQRGQVVLHCDQSVPVEYLVRVAGIATSLEAKVSIATRPDKK
jgi:biopolymer transport protein ExbD